MSEAYLGEFEQLVLLAVMRLGEGAYGLKVGDEIESVTGRIPSSGALYTTLDRLETKQYLASKTGETTDQRGGRPRRYFGLTREGLTALKKSRAALLGMWDGHSGVLDRT